jgi:hypothetical protein
MSARTCDKSYHRARQLYLLTTKDGQRSPLPWVSPGDVSKLERRTDMYVSTLAGYLQAIGADLEIRAVFPDGRAVKITQFSE